MEGFVFLDPGVPAVFGFLAVCGTFALGLSWILDFGFSAVFSEV